MDEFITIQVFPEIRTFSSCNIYKKTEGSQYARRRTPKNRYKIVMPLDKDSGQCKRYQPVLRGDL